VKNIFIVNLMVICKQRIREITLLVSFVLLAIVFTFITPYFAVVNNVKNLITQTMILLVVSLGQTIMLASGEVDMSVEGVVVITSVICAFTLIYNSLLLTIAVALLFGVFIGIMNYLLSIKIRIPSFLGSLALLVALRALSNIITGAKPITIKNQDFFISFSTGHVFSITMPIFYGVLLLIILHILVNNTTFGCYVFAVGGSEEAARKSGIKTKIIKLKVFVLTSVIAAFAGILLAARVAIGTGSSSFALNMGFDSILAAVMGGCVLGGGKGSILGTFFSVIVLAVLNNGLTHLHFTYQEESIVKSLLLITVVFAGNVLEKSKGRKIKV
jgi:ribose transport system permease protein